MLISQIAAMSENRVIARDGKLPWHLPADLKYFKNVTWGHHVLMGRKNYEAEGTTLKGRTNIIITRQQNYQVKDAFVFSTIREGIDFAERRGENELFIVGGGHIYRQTLQQTDKIYLTIIHREFEGDTFFPELDKDEWKTYSKRQYLSDQNNPHDHTYYIFQKR
jgi:dihydrofolate reductase